MLLPHEWEHEKHLLRERWEKLQTVEKKHIDHFLERFPYGENPFGDGENLNRFAVDIFRAHPDKVDLKEFARKLDCSEKTAETVLRGEKIEVLFPVVYKDKSARLVRALVIPLEEKEIITPDGEIIEREDLKEALETVRDLTGRGFFITFDRTDFDGKSLSLALYAALTFGKRAQNYAYTGVLLKNGRIEPVEGLEEKLQVARKEGIPLIFPDSSSLKHVEDLGRFFNGFSVPVSALFNSDQSGLFENAFPLKGEYLKKVFHLGEELHFDRPFNNGPDDYAALFAWLKDLGRELEEKVFSKVPQGVKVNIGLTLKVVATAFLSGIVFSKFRFPVEFYNYYKGEGYRKLFALEDDRITTSKGVEDYFDIYEPKGGIKSVYIKSKTEYDPSSEGTLQLVAKLKPLPEGEFLDIAGALAKYLRSLMEKLHGTKLFLELPNGVAFALGYLLEDYIGFVLTDRGKEVFTIKGMGDIGKKPQRVFLTNTFSLNMLQKKPGAVRFKPIDLREVKELLKEHPAVSYISHQSTAQVLTKLLDRPVEANRQNLLLEDGDRLVVFQLNVRPKEGQVFTEEELQGIVKSGNYSFWELEVNYT